MHERAGDVHTQICTLLLFSWGWVAKHFPTRKVLIVFSTALLKVGLAWLPRPLQCTAEEGLAPTSVSGETRAMFPPATALPFYSYQGSVSSSWASHKWDKHLFFWKSAKRQQVCCNHYADAWSQCWPILHSFSIAVQRQLSQVDEEPGVSAAIWTFHGQIPLLTHCKELLCLHKVRCERN